MTKKIDLLLWLNTKEIVKTHEINQWGLEHYYNRADRTKRDFIEEGCLTPMSEFKKECRGIDTKEGVYEVNHSEIDSYIQPNFKNLFKVNTRG